MSTAHMLGPMPDLLQGWLAHEPPGQHVDVFEERYELLSAALDAVESRSQVLTSRLTSSEAHCNDYAHRLHEAEDAVARLRSDQANSKDRENMLRHEVQRLSALLEAQKLQATFGEERLQQLIVEERLRVDRLRSARDSALLQRDDAMSELASAYAEIDAMQATLADSALYVRQLRRKVVELELRHHNPAGQQPAASGSAAAREDDTNGVFSLAAIKAAIEKAVREAGQCEEAECKRRIRQLQLRWHPDKNAFLGEFCGEVTKIINEAVGKLSKA